MNGRRLVTWVVLLLLVPSLAMVTFMLTDPLLPGYDQINPDAGSGLENAYAVVAVLSFLSVPIVGSILATRRPRNPIGWILLVGGAGFIFASFSSAYVKRSITLGSDLPGYRVLDWLATPVGVLGFMALLIWLPMLFPDGRLPGRRWRAMAWTAAAVTVVNPIVGTISYEPGETGPYLPNPIAFGERIEAIARMLSELGGILMAGLVVLVFITVVLRFWRATGIERQQLKWFLAALCMLFLALIALALTLSAWAWFSLLAAVGLVMVAIGVAVLRYRLYEIDRIISRTIGWGLVTGLLVGAFALLVLGSSTLLEPLTGGNTLAVAGSTLVVALLFAPVRARVQAAVDRRFDRSRYDGERTLAAFGERLRDEVDLPTIRADVLATVETSVRPSRVGLWLRTPGAGR